jgi:hypothetical protein
MFNMLLGQQLMTHQVDRPAQAVVAEGGQELADVLRHSSSWQVQWQKHASPDVGMG